MISFYKNKDLRWFVLNWLLGMSLAEKEKGLIKEQITRFFTTEKRKRRFAAQRKDGKKRYWYWFWYWFYGCAFRSTGIIFYLWVYPLIYSV
jgi:hypothetical protein